MRLIDRIGILIKADAHGVLESVEDRRLLAKQLVREAELALEDKRARIAELRQDQQRLTLESQRLGALMKRLDEDVELAVSGEEDDLARAAIRKLLPLREAQQRLSERLVALRDKETRLSHTLAGQEQEFEILKTRLRAELATAEIDRSGEETFQSPVVTEEDVDLELLRRRRVKSASSPASSGSPSRGVE